MKIYHWAACAVCLAFMATGCHEAPVGDSFADTNYRPKGAIVNPGNVDPAFFDFSDQDNAFVAFDLTGKGETVNSAEVIVTHSGGASATWSNETSFPASVNVPYTDLLAALGLSSDDVELGDDFVFTFKPTTASGTFNQGTTLTTPVTCMSDLSGAMDFVSTNYFCGGDPLTGTVTLTDAGGGKYTCDDWAFGTYPECYGGTAASWGTLALTDVCNQISVSGADNYGDTWEWTITSIDGATLNFDWTQTYGEFGTVSLTRKDGKDWPPLFN